MLFCFFLSACLDLGRERISSLNSNHLAVQYCLLMKISYSGISPPAPLPLLLPHVSAINANPCLSVIISSLVGGTQLKTHNIKQAVKNDWHLLQIAFFSVRFASCLSTFPFPWLLCLPPDLSFIFLKDLFCTLLKLMWVFFFFFN